jgi:hypothetical protein
MLVKCIAAQQQGAHRLGAFKYSCQKRNSLKPDRNYAPTFDLLPHMHRRALHDAG